MTFCKLALTDGFPGKSTRRKMIPVFGGAGFKVMLTFSPECSPIPLQEIEELIVF
jgi:hypothetical protein